MLIFSYYCGLLFKAVKEPEENKSKKSKGEIEPKGKPSNEEIKKTLKRKSDGTESSTSKKSKEGMYLPSISLFLVLFA